MDQPVLVPAKALLFPCKCRQTESCHDRYLTIIKWTSDRYFSAIYGQPFP